MGWFSNAVRRVRDETSETWDDWGREAVVVAATVTTAGLAGGAVGGVAGGAAAGTAASVDGYRDHAQRAAAEDIKAMRSSVARAQKRLADQAPKGINPEDMATRRRQRLAAAFSRNDTILTGPLGVTGSIGGGPKRLIGA